MEVNRSKPISKAAMNKHKAMQMVKMDLMNSKMPKVMMILKMTMKGTLN